MKSVTVSLLQNPIFGAVGILAFAAGFATPALAHHSAAMFDATKTVEHTGTVKQFLWTNPHSLLVLSVRNSDGRWSRLQLRGQRSRLSRTQRLDA